MPGITVLTMLIDCRQCTARSIACHDCVVTFLLDQAPTGQPADLSSEEIEAVAVLADHGVVPPLRLHLVVGGANQPMPDKPDSAPGGWAISR